MKTAVISVHLYFGIYATHLTSERVTFNLMFSFFAFYSSVFAMLLEYLFIIST